MTLTITLPMPANMANSRMHWRVKHQAKKAYWNLLDYHQTCGLIAKPPKVPHPRVRLSSAMVLGNAMDHDNAIARHKWALDWLVTRGYIADDRRANLVWDGFPSQRVTRKEPPTITLTLTPESE